MSDYFHFGYDELPTSGRFSLPVREFTEADLDDNAAFIAKSVRTRGWSVDYAIKMNGTPEWRWDDMKRRVNAKLGAPVATISEPLSAAVACDPVIASQAKAFDDHKLTTEDDAAIAYALAELELAGRSGSETRQECDQRLASKLYAEENELLTKAYLRKQQDDQFESDAAFAASLAGQP